MKKTNNQAGFAPILLIIIVALIIIGGGGWYFATRHTTATSPSTTPASGEQQPTNEQPQITGEVTSTMDGIIGRGQNLECDVKVPTHGTGNSPFNTGKLWTTGNKGRSSLSADVSGLSMEANAIFKDGIGYTWIVMGGTKTGFKINPSDANTNMTPQQKQQAEQVRQNMLFNCHPWTPDETKFDIPTDVTFR